MSFADRPESAILSLQFAHPFDMLLPASVASDPDSECDDEVARDDENGEKSRRVPGRTKILEKRRVVILDLELGQSTKP